MKKLIDRARLTCAGRGRRLAACSCVSLAVAGFALASQSGPAAATATSAATKCGQVTNTFAAIPNNDPDHVLAKLPAAVQARYANWAGQVTATPWTTYKGTKGPWKIGFITFPLTSPYNVDLVNEMKREFALAKKAGLVTGSLQLYVQPNISTATPEQQIAAIQQMVRDGVNGIMILPLAGQPLAPAIDAAGKAGVPVVVVDNDISNSKYVVNIFDDKQTPANAIEAGRIKKGNVLIVRGLAGNSVEQPIENGTEAVVKSCPGLSTVGTIFGSWSAPAAKVAVTSWLAAHPGVKVNLVLQNGAMMAGIIGAFESAGQTVPPIADGGCQGGDLSWWLQHKSNYSTVGTCNSGFQTAYTAIQVLFRVLGGRGLKLRDIAVTAPVVTNANLAKYATPGKSLTWAGEPRGPLDARCGTVSCMNGYFNKPGTPGNFLANDNSQS
jgi:ribose transport system substrate-binding protein